jgi:hypothetical protein
MRPAGGRAGRRAALLVTVLAVGSATACGSDDTATAGAGSDRLPQGDESVRLDPADFTVEITNEYWPMKRGDRWLYEETNGEGVVQRGETSVRDETRTVAGIEALVIHDVLNDQDGALVEDTTDWYAQDSVGNIWYLGEQTAEYENGQVTSTEGSWEAGVDGAQAGIIVPAAPKPGMEYRQEFLADEAEDQAIVLSTSEQAQTPTGIYTGALLTRDTTPLEPELVELKWYAPGVGPVLTLTPSGEVSREVLVQAPAGS